MGEAGAPMLNLCDTVFYLFIKHFLQTTWTFLSLTLFFEQLRDDSLVDVGVRLEVCIKRFCEVTG